ncbi:MAG: DUF2258 domain-containing protein [Acidilobaceae archaeon]|nr:DUF2258 domain-containing protein [Acidilobaceae archaeon]
MVQLRSGVVIAGGYANKVRRTLFAQISSMAKKGEIPQVPAKEVAEKAKELNTLLYELLVNELKVDKGDVVRISIEYEIKDGTISWKWETLDIEVWRRVDSKEVAEKLMEFKNRKLR